MLGRYVTIVTLEKILLILYNRNIASSPITIKIIAKYL